MKMLSKSKMNILLALCLISITSIGFSSWVIVQDSNPLHIQGNIDVDNVINSKDYVYLDTSKGDNESGITCFNYTDTGYLNESDTITDTGYIDAYFIIDLEKCKTLFTEYNSIDVLLTLKYANNNPTTFNIFEDDNQSSGYRKVCETEIICDDSITVTKGTISGIDNKQYSLPLTFNNILNQSSSNLQFQVRYKFFATTGNYFYDYIYRYLYGNNISFALNVTIKGSN